MKTEWRFHFETHDFIFESEHQYIGTATPESLNKEKHGNRKRISFDMRITPDTNCNSPTAKQTGSLFLTVPLTYEEAKDVVHELTCVIAERISFESGKFDIHGGMVVCKRIPETPEEEKEIGDRPYAVDICLEEVLAPPNFDSNGFAERSKTPLDIGLVSQYNAAKESQNPVDRFLGFFKILESQFTEKNEQLKLKKQLENNENFFKIYLKTFKFKSEKHARDSFRKFIERTVHARHRCAHLRVNKNFGYVPIDPRIKEEVEPYLAPLEALTYETIISYDSSI